MNMIVSIEGNIGSGKSTLLENLKKHFKNNPKIIFLKEPVDDWETITDENNKTILEKFYADQDKYSFPFQMMAYISRLAILKETIEKNPGSIIITERSLYTDKMVFAKMLFDNGKIELVNYKIYLKWFDVFAKEYPIEKIIYVYSDPEICLKRIMKRSRHGEEHIPLAYLSSCHNYHTRMLDKNLEDCVCDDQLVLDGCLDIYENENIVSEWINEIEKFIMA
jgi:deoxycitidine kinase/deoxyguanosine kinase